MSLKVSNRTNGHSASDSNKPTEIAIIGGGIAGLILAIGLQKYSYINVSVYESAHKFGEVGAGVVLGPNAQRAMQLIDPKILEGYNRRAGFDDGAQDEHGMFPWTTVYKGQEPDLDEFVIRFSHKTRGSTIHRAHFVDELVKLLEHGRAHLGKRLDHVYETDAPDAPITLHFTDGSTASADIVVGADGVHSVVRKHVLPHDPTNSAFFTGTCQYRATIPMEKAEASLGKLDQKVAQLVGENGTLFGIPLSNRTIYYIAVTVFDQKAPWNKDKWVADANIDDVKGYFADWDDHARKTVELLPTDGSTMAWSVWEMPPASTYYKDRVAIIGDAAHASTAFQGAGAGQGVEDALILEKLLGKYLDPAQRCKSMPTAISAAPHILHVFDTVRRFRSQKVVTTSRETGRILTCLEPGIGSDAASLRKALQGRQDWIWDFDQERSVKDAYQLFDEIKDAGERQLM
ncbi:hypothetical protein PRZ48_010479 [Zasmidium cellare]|uniref:FAD-binding domain-containing protein n=1 Tax=Zasmidium cellare TaxID=395010 RepID=A0ABR0E8S2_ZASCE|nr:hypothetical protein PRZ48_010479 [Zasmidium cellare]